MKQTAEDERSMRCTFLSVAFVLFRYYASTLKGIDAKDLFVTLPCFKGKWD